MIARIVSGGQTGVDRAALDAAIATGVEYGGWCPRGGSAEDFARPPGLLAEYPALAETPTDDPRQRTEWNVRDSDATLILTRPGVGSRGTELTVALARDLGRPYAVVDLAGEAAPAAPAALLAVVGGPAAIVGGAVLNVAGPRESEAPGIYAQARELLGRWLAQAARGSGGTSTT